MLAAEELCLWREIADRVSDHIVSTRASSILISRAIQWWLSVRLSPKDFRKLIPRNRNEFAFNRNKCWNEVCNGEKP